MSAPINDVPLPQHQLLESPNSREIIVNGWHITSHTNPISRLSTIDDLQASLGIPPPEMTFGSNALELHHEKSGYKYIFDTEEALKGVKRGELEEGDGKVQVGYADAWLKSRTGVNSSVPMPKTVTTKPYDWTYTTTYGGHISTNSQEPKFSPDSWVPAEPSAEAHQIPIAELSKPDPILFYAEIPLFEDELHDNGSSGLIVRIRVMPKCIFILCRHTLRVDGVLFRTFDTRIYHSFDSKIIIKETSGWEAPYDIVKNHLPKRNDLTPLTDPGFIASILSQLPKSLTQGDGAGTKWRGMGTRREILTFR